jgi:hypothetical protein
VNQLLDSPFLVFILLYYSVLRTKEIPEDIIPVGIDK